MDLSGPKINFFELSFKSEIVLDDRHSVVGKKDIFGFLRKIFIKSKIRQMDHFKVEKQL